MNSAGIKALAAEYFDNASAFRRHLHENPELSFSETGTAGYIREKLSSFGIAQEAGHTGNSIVGVLPGTGDSAAFRAEIDALPLTEATGLPFSSKNPGVMHACGHDAHTAVLLAFAKLLSEHPELVHSGVKFIFQQAEECPPGGASALVSEGVLSGVNRIFAWHIAPELPLGTIGIGIGPRSSTVASFSARIKGKGGHGAFPHNAVSAITAGCAAIAAIDNLAAQRRDASQPAVVTVSHFASGQEGVTNIIPGEALLEGNLRTLDNDLMTRLLNELRRLITSVCSAYGCTCEMSVNRGYPPVINSASLFDRITPSLKELGYDMPLTAPMMAGDDFAYYSMHCPAIFLNIGNMDIDRPETCAFVHNPKFILSEKSMLIALEAFLAMYLNS